jgi:hypothetical protein
MYVRFLQVIFLFPVSYDVYFKKILWEIPAVLLEPNLVYSVCCNCYALLFANVLWWVRPAEKKRKLPAHPLQAPDLIQINTWFTTPVMLHPCFGMKYEVVHVASPGDDLCESYKLNERWFLTWLIKQSRLIRTNGSLKLVTRRGTFVSTQVSTVTLVLCPPRAAH